MIAVILDRRRARFFDVSNGGAVELPELRSQATPGGRYHSDRADSPGRGERKYHQRRAEEERRHYERVIERLAALAVEGRDDPIVIAGPGPAPATFQRALPPDVARRVIGMTHLNPARLTRTAVLAAARAAAASSARDEEAKLITELEEGLGKGRATNGARETLRALAKRAVRTLLVRPDIRASGFRCTDSERLVLSAVDCRGEGQPRPVRDIIAAAMQLALEQDATLALIQDPDLAKRVDGLAALLRYSEDA
jgi:peptide subunit release factor 1 (eRF1)